MQRGLRRPQRHAAAALARGDLDGPALPRRRRRGPRRPAARPRRRPRGRLLRRLRPGQTARARPPGRGATTAASSTFRISGRSTARDARRITFEMAAILLRMAARAPGRHPPLPHRRRDRGGRGRGRDRRDPAPRGRRGDRPRPRRARGAPRRRPALARAGLVAAEHLRRPACPSASRATPTRGRA